MSAQTIYEAFAPAEARYKEAVMFDTWGHLAPKKNQAYKGRIVYAVGCFGSDNLNPTAIVFDFGELDSSPWFFEKMAEFLSDQKENLRKEGCVYEFTGSFRNYQFKGRTRLLLDCNAKTVVEA